MFNKNYTNIVIFSISLLLLPFSIFTAPHNQQKSVSLWNKICSGVINRFYVQHQSFKNIDIDQIAGGDPQNPGGRPQQDRTTVVHKKGLQVIFLGDGHVKPIESSSRMENSTQWQKNPYKKYAQFKEPALNSTQRRKFDPGATAAHYVAAEVPEQIINELQQLVITKYIRTIFRQQNQKDFHSIFGRLFKKTNDGLKVCLDNIYENIIPKENQSSVSKGGSTGLAATIYNDMLWIAHAGDSRALVFDKSHNLLYATHDHKASRVDEKARIEQAGGNVTSKEEKNGDIVFRVNGDVATSRGFGDHNITGLTEQPDIKSYPLKDVGTLIMGSDGLFDYFDKSDQEKHYTNSNGSPTNNTIARFVNDRLTKNSNINGFASELITKSCFVEARFKPENLNSNDPLEGFCPAEIVRQNAGDNITAIVAQIK